MSGSVYPCQNCGTNRYINEEMPCPNCKAMRSKAEQAKDVEMQRAKQQLSKHKKWFRVYFDAPDCSCRCHYHEETCGVQAVDFQDAYSVWAFEFEPDRMGLRWKSTELMYPELTLEQQIERFEVWQQQEQDIVDAKLESGKVKLFELEAKPAQHFLPYLLYRLPIIFQNNA